MANLYGFHDTASALKALQTALEAVQIGAPPAQAFQKVDFFDMMDVTKALQEVFHMQRRVCMIVHDMERFDNTRAGRELRMRKIDDIMLIIGDVNVGNRNWALYGSPDGKTVGALPLKDAILNAILAGPLQPGVSIEPKSGQQFLLQNKVRDELQGRVFWQHNFELRTGNLIQDLGPQPIF